MKFRTRKVKCDETKPACRRCLSTDRVCEGYGVWGGGGNTYAQRYPIRFADRGVMPELSITRVQLTPLRDVYEKQHLDWFICNSAKKFPGIFGSDFWHSLVFPATTAEPAVLHAVIALGSAHRNRPKDFHKFKSTLDEDFTIRQYSRTALGILLDRSVRI